MGQNRNLITSLKGITIVQMWTSSCPLNQLLLKKIILHQLLVNDRHHQFLHNPASLQPVRRAYHLSKYLARLALKWQAGGQAGNNQRRVD